VVAVCPVLDARTESGCSAEVRENHWNEKANKG
jgi:hypothetical protein